MQTTSKKFPVKMLILCAIFAALSAVGAFIRIPLPVIPFTLQLPFVALSGILLGGRNAMFSQLAYLLVGLVGFPVFTKGGGLGYVFEPSFGFLIGFVLMAFVIGKLVERMEKPTLWGIFFACAVGILVNYLCGVIYMYFILNFYLKSAITIWAACWSGALIFLPKDLLLCFATALISFKLLPALKKSKLI